MTRGPQHPVASAAALPDAAGGESGPASGPAPGDPAAREAERQQWLLQAVRGGVAPTDPPGWLAGSPSAQLAGLRAYRANAAATAVRALAAAYPTVQQVLGAQPFAALAQALWQTQPPLRGDLAAWGDGLPGVVATDIQLAGTPYLADVARLDWAVHAARQAADDDAPVTGLPLLGSADPAGLRLRLRAGHAVLVSAHPVHAIWAAHRSDAADRFAGARSALAQGRGESVRIRRRGWAVEVDAIDAATASFEQHVLRGATLDAVLDRMAPGFDVAGWLVQALQQDMLAAVVSAPAATGPAAGGDSVASGA